ncbi:MAG: GTP 3',8-cyclase MoaA [Planctomycetes bacterium]|nr:GTP 3',8-cyclase MoaA [Planctomycetota bacterium]
MTMLQEAPLAAAVGPAVFKDRFGRPFTYLRISVTDACNLRCVYCMPENAEFLPGGAHLTDDELALVVESAADCGVRKVRLSGGEPLLRRGIGGLVERLAGIRGIRELALTTNGTRLAGFARRLAKAGLQRVNVSMDTLDEDKFRRITHNGTLEHVWAGIAAAEEAGLRPLKINVVLMKGLNEDEVEAFAALTLVRNLQVRFIELMPLGEAKDCTLAGGSFGYVSNESVWQRLVARFGTLRPAPESGTAKVYCVPGARGTIGFISAMSAPFCERCDRLRLTADGKLRACLLEGGEFDARALLRTGLPREGKRELLHQAFKSVADRKPEVHAGWRDLPGASMVRIGG